MEQKIKPSSAGTAEEQAEAIRLLTTLAKAGGWIIRYAEDGSVSSAEWGDSFRELMGYTDEADFPNELAPFLSGIHPEDREGFVSDLSAEALDEETMRQRGYEFRFFRKDGSMRWYRSMGHLFRDPDGRPEKFLGVTIDITESKKLDTLYGELQNEAASLNTIHEMLGSGKWTMDFDESGTMVRVNWSDEFRRMLGYRGQEDFPDVLESWSDLLHPDDRDRVLKEFNDTISDYTGEKTYDVDYRLLTRNRRYRWCRAVGKK